ncbi:hypothetical protein Tcan_03801 [Toxocara canis]|uniref:Uncharacterized protein n=1 Tax=Toxocara canis TaxID=6265 RepID=A0A0B2VTW2_TOXCA|nr:hypothetical protein Tcan_03801 [Toxocara canis]
MDHLVARIRRQGRLSTLSDALLLALLANSDCLPERVANGVLLCTPKYAPLWGGYAE